MQTTPTSYIKELFFNPTTLASLPVFISSLGLAAVLGYLLGLIYTRFGKSASNRVILARNFLLLTVTTTLVIAIIKTSLALSLGLVGALSIVRFRAAIKEPEELAYLFLAISIGLGLGAGQALLTVVALAVIFGLIALRSLARRQEPAPNLYITVSGPRSGALNGSGVLSLLKQGGAEAVLRRLDETPESFEAAYQVQFGTLEKLEAFTKQLRQQNPEVRVACLEERGLSA